MEYPPNSAKAKTPPPAEPKKVERVTTGEATTRKKPLGKQFKETFLGGDAKGAASYAVFSVLIPAAKDAVADAGSQAIERLIFGESRGPSKRRAPNAPNSGSQGFINYNRVSQTAVNVREQSRQMSARARATHDFDEVILADRTEANNVLDSMFDIVNRYEAASVADLYELIGLPSNHVDQTWGWKDMRGCTVSRVRNGFLLDMTEPEPLN